MEGRLANPGGADLGDAGALQGASAAMVDIAGEVDAFAAAGGVAGQALDDLVIAALMAAERRFAGDAGLADLGRAKIFGKSGRCRGHRETGGDRGSEQDRITA